MWRRAAPSLFAVLSACAPLAPLPATTPELPLAAWERELVPGSEAGPNGSSRAGSPALAKTVNVPAPAPIDGAFAPPATTAASPIPGGSACLEELREHKVPHHVSAPVMGVATPVVLTGPLHGIRFYASDKRPFLADCRLLLALDEVTPDWAALGVTEVRFSGAYVYKLTHPGRMSMHAYGLAADLHAFTVHGVKLEVKTAFERGRGGACSSSSPMLNVIACRARTHGVFKEQLGPDDNAAHFDHFHFGLKPLPGEVADDLPMPPAPGRARRTPHATKHRQSTR
jgi:hypothetical protein